MNIHQQPYSKASPCHNFLFHPLYEKKRAALAIAAHVIISAVSLGLWQIPFWIVNCFDKKKVKVSHNSKISSLASTTITKPQKAASSVPSGPQPLLKLSSIPAGAWMDVVQGDAFLQKGIVGSLPYTAINAIPRCLLDVTFLNMTVKEWFTKGTAYIMHSPAHQAQVAIIKSRIADLNDAIQLEERLKRLGYPNLKMIHLLLPWASSPLPYVLMMDDELSELIALDIDEDDFDFFIEEMAERVELLAKQQQPMLNQDLLTPKTIQEMPIVSMPHLTAKTINRLGGHTPAIAFSVLSSSVIPELDIQALSDDQLDVLFAVEEKVHALTILQVNDCLSRVSEERLKNLSDAQIKAFDLSKIDKEIFNALFSPNSSRTMHLLQNYDLKEIYQICQYFTSARWLDLSEEQIHNLDFSKINKTIFEVLFHDSPKMRERLQKYTVERIYEICMYFEYHHWMKLSDEQILDLDFDTIKLDYKIFCALFNPYDARTKAVLPKISDKQLMMLKPYLTGAYAFFLSYHQKQLI